MTAKPNDAYADGKRDATLESVLTAVERVESKVDSMRSGCASQCTHVAWGRATIALFGVALAACYALIIWLYQSLVHGKTN